MQTDYDFLAEHSTTHVVRQPGERVLAEGALPPFEGHYLMAGVAALGAFHKVGELPGGPTRHISPDHRWVGIWQGDAYVLHDLNAGGQRGFAFQPPENSFDALHPSGEMLGRLTSHGIEILLPDGQPFTRAAFPAQPEESTHQDIAFSVCGNYL